MSHRALIVAIVSTPNQATEDKASIPDQLASCRAACAARGWAVAKEITIPGHSRNYDDLAELVASCPEYGDIIRTINSGEVSLFVTIAYDRLWRTDALRAQVTAICRRNAVQAFSTREPMEPMTQEDYRRDGNIAARWVETVIGLSAESENITRVKRANTGKKGVINRGLVLCGPRIWYGYKREAKGIIIPDPDKAPWVVRIYELRANDRLSFRSISRELGRLGAPYPTPGDFIWPPRTIARIIQSPIYKGTVFWGDAVTKVGQHQPLVSVELWERAQAIRKAYTGPKRVQPLSGLCVCGYCGWHMAYSTPKVSFTYLACGKYTSYGRDHCCPNRHPATLVHDYVLDRVVERINDREAYIANRKAYQSSRHPEDDLAVITRALEDVATKRKRLLHTFMDDSAIRPDEMRDMLDELEHRRLALESQASEVRARAANLQAASDNLARLAGIVDKLAGMSGQEQARIYRSIIRAVILKRGQSPEIDWL